VQGERGKGARPVWEGSTRLRRPLKLPAPWRFAGDTACVVTHAPSQRTVATNGKIAELFADQNRRKECRYQ
jgi:hypothetical protein